MSKAKITFRKKSLFQKEDCINRSADYDCQNSSTLEAVIGTVAIRCCADKRCKRRASELARKLTQ